MPRNAVLAVQTSELESVCEVGGVGWGLFVIEFAGCR